MAHLPLADNLMTVRDSTNPSGISTAPKAQESYFVSVHTELLWLTKISNNCVRVRYAGDEISGSTDVIGACNWDGTKLAHAQQWYRALRVMSRNFPFPPEE